MDGWTCAWEQALAAVASVGAEWEDTRHLQERCPPQPLLRLPGFRLSQSSALSGISAGMAQCSQSIPDSVCARPHCGCRGYRVPIRRSAQLAPGPTSGACTSEIFISMLRGRHQFALNLSEYFIPHLANGTAIQLELVLSPGSERRWKKRQVGVPQACPVTGAMAPACPTTQPPSLLPAVSLTPPKHDYFLPMPFP